MVTEVVRLRGWIDCDLRSHVSWGSDSYRRHRVKSFWERYGKFDCSASDERSIVRESCIARLEMERTRWAPHDRLMVIGHGSTRTPCELECWTC